uniref:Uncharacterized protein n=1 Tax=uncultured bacterium A1Q1_fos_2101 TaxID=1256561 RepID=L7W044_9BACT|nr:hypothetical protein [uncultured bacterium A1Q1_fos_2101]
MTYAWEEIPKSWNTCQDIRGNLFSTVLRSSQPLASWQENGRWAA